MAMVKITNGEVTQIVSMGAYVSQYKNLGFSICGGNKAPVKNNEAIKNVKPVKDNTKNEEDTNVNDNVNDEEVDDFEELLEKPLSQWTNEELKSFVNAKDIDTSSAKKTSEVRSLVKVYLDNEAKKEAEA